MNELGQRIASKCNELNITAKELADFAEIKYSTLNNLMNTDNPNPTLYNMKRLSIALGTSIDYLTFGDSISDNEELQIIVKELKEIDTTDKKRIMYMIRMMIAESKNK